MPKEEATLAHELVGLAREHLHDVSLDGRQRTRVLGFLGLFLDYRQALGEDLVEGSLDLLAFELVLSLLVALDDCRSSGR